MLEKTKKRLQQYKDDHKIPNRLYALSKEEIENITNYDLGCLLLNSTEELYRGRVLGFEHALSVRGYFDGMGQFIETKK